MKKITKNIIIDDAVPFAEEIFSSLGKVTCLAGKDINGQHLLNADALVIRSRTKITPPLLNHSKIDFVGSSVVGLDHIDQDYLAQNNIKFYSAQGCNANSVVEYVITCIINFAKQQNISLKNKTIGIIGVGNVGKLLQQKALALGLTVLANDPPRQQKGNLPNFVDLNTALSADIVSFHTPLTSSGQFATKQLLNKNNFSQIKAHALLINTARGEIIDEQHWIKYAKQQPHITNIIDCWQNEPNINPELYALADIATPHIAGHALDAKIKGALMVYKQLCKHWQQPENTSWRVNLPPLKIDNKTNVYEVLKQCYQPLKDHQAIDLTNSLAFENYRRDYPTRREWTEYLVKSTGNARTDQLLNKLGFKLS